MSLDSQSSREISGTTSPVIYLLRKDGDERTVDLIDLMKEFWARKLLISAITSAFIVAGVLWALLSTPVYRVEVVLAPSQATAGSSISSRLGGLASLAGIDLNSGNENTQAVAILNSRAFVESFIADNGLLSVLYADAWDASGKKWRNPNPDEQPNLWIGVNYFLENVLTVEVDPVTGLVKLSIEWTDPEAAAEWAQEIVDRVNEQLRVRALRYAESKLKYLNEELQRNTLIEVRSVIAMVIQDQVQAIALAKSEAEYAFRVIDPPRVPMERIRPKRSLIVVLATLAGGLISLCIVTVLFLIRLRQSRSE